MSDWQVGDLALCVDAADRFSTWPEDSGLLQQGATYTVTAITAMGLGLRVAEVDARNPSGFWESRFRKIRPDEHQECEPEFVALLKRSKAPTPAEREKLIIEALFPNVRMEIGNG